MEKSIKNRLCKFVRGTGLSKQDTLTYIDLIGKWVDSCGAQWTVDRLKEYHHWYITLQAGSPVIPEWTKKTAEGKPKGIFAKIFALKNPQRALAALSVHTAFVALGITPQQKEKFVKAVNASSVEADWENMKYAQSEKSFRSKCFHVSPTRTPGFDALTGTTIPVGGEKPIHLSQKSLTREQVVLAYCKSWLTVPDETLRYLVKSGQPEQIPVGKYLDAVQVSENCPWGEPFSPGGTSYRKVVGRIAFLQEPSLKARVIANPNRIAQAFLHPLQSVWMGTLKEIPTDCTFNQDAGVSWVKRKLSEGLKLSSTDLSSATDLIDLFGCLNVVHQTWYGFKPHNWSRYATYNAINQGLREKSLPEGLARYMYLVAYFGEISRGKWESPKVDPMFGNSWKRGQPLGTEPSFGLLGLTNNACAYNAAVSTGLNPWDSFRVIGDDIIMDSRMENAYRHYITALGAKINDTKSVSSDRVVEFAGRVITKSQDFLKRVKFKEISDNQFIKLVGMLGDQATVLLRPRQRRQYANFKYVPGVVVEGPYSPNSYNEPLVDRYTWYLTASGLLDERPEPLREQMDAVTFCNTIYFTLAESDEYACWGANLFNHMIPRTFSEDFQSSLATQLKTQNRDPRLYKQHGKTMLQVFEEVSTSGNFQKYLQWKQEQETAKTPSPSDSSPSGGLKRKPRPTTQDWEIGR